MTFEVEFTSSEGLLRGEAFEFQRHNNMSGYWVRLANREVVWVPEANFRNRRGVCGVPSLAVLFVIGMIAAVTPLAYTQEASTHNLHKEYFVEYSPTSSPIIMGKVSGRSLLEIGAAYTVAVLKKGNFDLSYRVEFRPFVLESDPALKSTCVLAGPRTSCTTWDKPSRVVTVHSSYSYIEDSPEGPVQATRVFQYIRQDALLSGMSPLGYELRLPPRWHARPVMTGQAGFLVGKKDFPVDKSSNFNFTFGGGVGLERSIHGKTVRLMYSYQHISNDDIGHFNPGADFGVFRVSYRR